MARIPSSSTPPTICDKALQPLDSGLSTARQAGFYPALPFLSESSTGEFNKGTVLLFDGSQSHELPSAPGFRR